MTETMPVVQKQSILDLITDLKNKYGGLGIYGHKEFYQTDCPGTNYPLQDLKDGVLGAIEVPIKIEEVKKVNDIVCYSNDVDRRAAEYLADALLCPVIQSDLPFDYTTVKNVYCIGGPGKLPFTGYSKKTIAGSDRYDTCQQVLNFIKNGFK